MGGLGEGRCHAWTPPVCQAFICDGLKVWIAAMHPDYGQAWPVSLMEYVGEFLITLTSSRLFDSVWFDPPRSDLSCHHIMIAQAIGGSVLLFATRLMLLGS
jgi:hypothetical protein